MIAEIPDVCECIREWAPLEELLAPELTEFQQSVLVWVKEGAGGAEPRLMHAIRALKTAMIEIVLRYNSEDGSHPHCDFAHELKGLII